MSFIPGLAAFHKTQRLQQSATAGMEGMFVNEKPTSHARQIRDIEEITGEISGIWHRAIDLFGRLEPTIPPCATAYDIFQKIELKKSGPGVAFGLYHINFGKSVSTEIRDHMFRLMWHCVGMYAREKFSNVRIIWDVANDDYTSAVYVAVMNNNNARLVEVPRQNIAAIHDNLVKQTSGATISNLTDGRFNQAI